MRFSKSLPTRRLSSCTDSPDSASRLSTRLHATRHRETLRETEGPLLEASSDRPHRPTESTLNDGQSAITLFAISWPVLAVFIGFVWTSGWIELDWSLTFWVMVVYGVTVRATARHTDGEADFVGQVAFSIYLAQVMTLFFWSKNLDPEYVSCEFLPDLPDFSSQLVLPTSAFQLDRSAGSDVPGDCVRDRCMVRSGCDQCGWDEMITLGRTWL